MTASPAGKQQTDSHVTFNNALELISHDIQTYTQTDKTVTWIHSHMALTLWHIEQRKREDIIIIIIIINIQTVEHYWPTVHFWVDLDLEYL